MNNSNLKKAMIFGTIALIWSVPSLNIFGTAASIVSWIAYGRNVKGTAAASGVLYIIATLLSLLLAAALVSCGEAAADIIFSSSDNFLTEFFNEIAGISLVGDVLYVIAAVFSFKGNKELKMTNSDNNGFFE